MDVNVLEGEADLPCAKTREAYNSSSAEWQGFSGASMSR